MKDFLKKTFFFILPILVLALIGEILLRKIPNDYSYKKTYLDINSSKIEVLFLGSSHVFAGVEPAFIKAQSFNAAMVSQSLKFDFEILKKYSGKYTQLKYIVLPVDYFSLYTTLETSIEEWRVKNYNIYFGINTNKKIEYNTEILSNKIKPNLGRIYKYYFKNISDITCSPLGRGNDYISTSKKDLFITGKEAAERHLAKNNQYFNENVEMLKSIVEFAQARNIKVLLFTSPTYKTYYQNLDNNQLSNTVNASKKIDSMYNNCDYFNFINDSSFIEADFYDADHLNEIGAKKFTLKLDSLLKVLK